MAATEMTMAKRKRITLIAHDNRKLDLLAWARYNKETLSWHELSSSSPRR